MIAVLGNHDWHADRCAEITSLLAEAGVEMLNRSHTVRDVRGTEIGIVGTKGFIGGFPDSELPDFGEPLLRRGLRGDDRRGGGARRRAGGDRGLRAAHRPDALRADRRQRSWASGR